MFRSKNKVHSKSTIISIGNESGDNEYSSKPILKQSFDFTVIAKRKDDINPCKNI